MNEDGRRILEYLDRVERERAQRTEVKGLRERVDAVKTYQHARFARTYQDLLAGHDYAAATRFFLDDLYGPHDFSDRDAQFARTVPALVRLFPADVVRTVRTLAELHAISEGLDTAMGRSLAAPFIESPSYCEAWQKVGQPALRDRQLEAMLEVGSALIGFTRNPMLYSALRMMRGPARLAGLSVLQNFLERGFNTFKRLPQPHEFLNTIEMRERRIASALFAGDASSVS